MSTLGQQQSFVILTLQLLLSAKRSWSLFSARRPYQLIQSLLLACLEYQTKKTPTAT